MKTQLPLKIFLSLLAVYCQMHVVCDNMHVFGMKNKGGEKNCKKPHAYSDIKVEQPPSRRCFQLCSSVTRFVPCKNSTGRGFVCFAKGSFQHELFGK